MSSGGDPSARAAYRCLAVVVFSLVFLQRFTLPVMSLPLILPIVLVVSVVMTARRLLVTDHMSTLVLSVGLGAALLSATANQVLLQRPVSNNSLLLLLLIYAPFALKLHPGVATSAYRRSLHFFSSCMVAASLLVLGFYLAQLAGWSYQDLIAAHVPSSMLLPDYNTSYPIAYGASLYKSNGFVFLEPSFASQFLALAVLVQLRLGLRHRRIVLFVAALLATVSGTGLLLLGVGLFVFALRHGARGLLIVAVLGVVAAALLSLTPLQTYTLGRSTEVGSANTSGNARFVAPYRQVGDAFQRDRSTFLIGQGPGSTSRAAANLFNPQGLQANYAAAPKLGAEYGFFVACIFGTGLILIFTRRAPSAELAVACLMIYFILSGSLLQPATAHLCLWLTVWSAGSKLEVGTRRAT